MAEADCDRATLASAGLPAARRPVSTAQTGI
jgi:hypothetical protein